MKRFLSSAAVVAILFGAGAAMAAPEKTECLAGAKPGGGFDLTCRLVSNSLLATKMIPAPMAVTYMEGGVGATAYNHVIGSRPSDPGLVVAASSGSALLLAQGKFGKHDETAVRWLGAVGTDYGVIAVAADSPITSLDQLVKAYKDQPNAFPVGGGGAVGSQDWMKAAVVAKGAGVPPRQMRYAALEGGGAVATALQGGHIKIASGDAGEMAPHHKAGKVRILAVMADERLPGDLADVPTAKEQGYDLTWPVWRGYYVGPQVSDADYTWWVDTLATLVKTPEFQKEREERGLFPLAILGKDFDDRVRADVARFKELAKEAGL
ncbi:Bug family tripartite tricarboxylate transporter substrate binding protein [Azospirillum halopraeferens]|uniref:Bug family tripartite tricarboxylate transporter substrate binding protein n=1 Tax=Azospirillum halopraeferens TaxID=34010 RepID=UPI0003FE4FC1|nr:tripartite tricarboxylate transporter substrate-binding protein [Azospirillum halopraeferens]